MSLLRRLNSVSWILLRQSKVLSRSANTPITLDGSLNVLVSKPPKKHYDTKILILAGGLFLIVGGGYIWFSSMKRRVCRQFHNGCNPKGLRNDGYIKRTVHDEIIAAFCDKSDTDGMFGIVFGAAGTGKSNVLRHICEERFGDKRNSGNSSGVLYVELGSDARFAHKIAETCGIPLEPNIIDVAIAKILPSWKKHLSLPLDNEITALAQVFAVIEEGGLLYKETKDKVPVLIIDGADIVAKNNKKLFDALLEWAKKCSNEDTVLVVMGSSDGHVLRYLDKQACKSRAAPLIEVTDFPTFDSLENLFMYKLGYPPKKHEAAQKVDEAAQYKEGTVRAVAEWMFNEITGGRLTDIYKATRLYKKLVAEDPNLQTEDIKAKIKHAFESEIKQALNKAMDDPFDLLQLEIAAAVVDRNLPHVGNSSLSVHELASELVHHGAAKSIDEAMKAVEKFVGNNILRYNVNQELVAHSMMAGKVLEDLVASSGIQQRRCWQKPWYMRLRGDEHSNECLLHTSDSSSQKHLASNKGNQQKPKEQQPK